MHILRKAHKILQFDEHPVIQNLSLIHIFLGYGWCCSAGTFHFFSNRIDYAQAKEYNYYKCHDSIIFNKSSHKGTNTY